MTKNLIFTQKWSVFSLAVSSCHNDGLIFILKGWFKIIQFILILALKSHLAHVSESVGMWKSKPVTWMIKYRCLLSFLCDCEALYQYVKESIRSTLLAISQLVIRVHMSDESSKTMMVDERQTVRQVLDSLLDKSHCGYSPDWSLVETISELQMGKGGPPNSAPPPESNKLFVVWFSPPGWMCLFIFAHSRVN